MRLTCCVPFCRRTTANKEGFEEWICRDHWMAVPKSHRRRKSNLGRRYTKKFGNTQFWEYQAGSKQRLEAVRLMRLWTTAWRICKRIAIERAVGI